MPDVIPTYTTEAFQRRFVEPSPHVTSFFKQGYEDFFCLRLAEVLPFVKLPIPPVRENAHTLIVLTRGHCELTLDAQKISLQTGELLLIQAGKIFAIHAMSKRANGFACHFKDDFLGTREHRQLQCLLSITQPSQYTLSEVLYSSLCHLLDRMATIYFESSRKVQHLQRAYLTALLLELANTTATVEPELLPSRYWWARRFRELICVRLDDPIRVEEVAATLGVSADHLCRCVKQTYGRTASALIIDLKLREAKMLLKQSALSISQIAGAIGMHDASYFSRWFKKHTRYSPLDFRRKSD